MIIYLRPWFRGANGTQYVDPNRYVNDLINSIDRDELGYLEWNSIPPTKQMMYIDPWDRGTVFLDPWKTWAEQGVVEGTLVYRVYHGRHWRHRPAGAA